MKLELRLRAWKHDKHEALICRMRHADASYGIRGSVRNGRSDPAPRDSSRQLESSANSSTTTQYLRPRSSAGKSRCYVRIRLRAIGYVLSALPITSNPNLSSILNNLPTIADMRDEHLLRRAFVLPVVRPVRMYHRNNLHRLFRYELTLHK